VVIFYKFVVNGVKVKFSSQFDKANYIPNVSVEVLRRFGGTCPEESEECKKLTKKW
jgi:hypothetical protein